MIGGAGCLKHCAAAHVADDGAVQDDSVAGQYVEPSLDRFRCRRVAPRLTAVVELPYNELAAGSYDNNITPLTVRPTATPR
jgi:hypothetical protein